VIFTDRVNFALGGNNEFLLPHIT